MNKFRFRPASFIPFQDLKAVERVRRIKRADLAKHANPDFHIRIVPDADVEFLWIADMFNRIRAAAAANRPVVMIMPNPWPSYAKVAHLINRAQIDCRHVHTFNMDEYADENGDIAPDTWPLGFGYAFKKYFWLAIDPKLRPPEKQIRLLSNATIKDYSKMLADLGGADICYSGPGWTG
ncbi:hypothetical protein HQ590_11375, partial [bacterium]|nr:hypothetical protein [bacterium]